MAISLIQSNAIHSSGGVTSLAVTLPTGITNGNLLIVTAMAGSNTPTISGPTGWTRVTINQPAGSSALIETSIWYLVVGSGQVGQTSWTFSLSASFGMGLTVEEWHSTNGWPVNPVDVFANGDTVGTPVQATAISSGTTATTAQASELWIASLAYRGSAQTESGITTGWSVDVEASASSNTVTMLYNVVSATGAATCSYNIATAQYWAGCVATFKDNPASTSPILTTSPTSLSFSAGLGGSNPASLNDTLSEINGFATAWTSSISYTSGTGWLSLSPTSGSLAANGTATITVSAALGALAAGTYTATITFTATTGGNTATIAVSFTITAPALSVSPTSHTYTATAGGVNPTSQNSTLTEINGVATSWTSTISYGSGSGWLTLTPSSGSLVANGHVSTAFSPATGSLVAGTYTATVTLTATTGGATATVSISLIVNAGAVNQYGVKLAGQDITRHVDQLSIVVDDTLGQGSGAGSSGATQGRAATVKFNTDLGPMNLALGAGQPIPVDTAMQGDGSSGYISIPTSGLPSGAASWSMEGWFQISSPVTGFQMPMSLGTRITNEEVNVYFQTGGAIHAELFGVTDISGPIPSLNQPHYMVVTYGSGIFAFYFDGVLQGSVVATPNITYGGAAFGAQGSPNNLFFPGVLDESAGYNYALPPDRIAAHMAAGTKPGSPGYSATVLSDNPIWYYKLSELSGTTAKDSSPNHRDGSIVGTVSRGLPSLVVNQPVLVRQGEIVITDSTGIIVFGGYATKYTDITTSQIGHTKQPFTAVEGIDYSTSLQRTLVNETFSAVTDVYIIQYILQKYAPWIKLDYLPTTPAYTFAIKNFRNQTVEQVLQTIAGITGFLIYVDYLKYIHYVSPTVASSAPYNISSNPDFITTFPAAVEEFLVDDNSAINRVFFYGGTRLSNDFWQDVSGLANGSNLVFVMAFYGSPLSTGGYGVTVNGVAYAVGTANGQSAKDQFISQGGTAQVLIDPGSRTATFDTGLAPASGSTVLIGYRYSYPLSLILTDENSHKFFGNPYLDGNIDDNTVFDVATAIQRCKVLLAQQSFGLTTLKLTLWNHPGVQSGMIIHVFNGVRGINGTYLVQDVQIEPIGGGNFVYHFTLGAWNWGLIDFLLKLPTLSTFSDNQTETQEIVDIQQLLNSVQVHDSWATSVRTGPYYARATPVGDGHDAYPGLSTISS